MRKIVFYALLPLVMLSSNSLSSVLLDYESAAERIFSAATSLKKQEVQVAMQQAQELQAGLWSNPSLEIEVGNFGGNQKQYKSWSQAASTYTISQGVPVRGRMAAQKCVAAWATCIALWDVEIERQDLGLSLRSALIDLAEAQELQKLQEERLKATQDTVANKTGRFAQKKVELAILSAQQALDKAAKSVQEYQRALAILWGSCEIDFDEVVYPLYILDAPEPYDTYVELLEQAPALNRSVSLFYSAQATSALEDARKYADIEVGGGAVTWHCASERSYFLELTLPLPLFDRNQGNRTAAQLGVWQAVYQMEQVSQDLKSHLVTRYTAWQHAYKEAMDDSKTSLDLAKEILDVAIEDKADADDIADARSSHLDAKETAIHAAAEAHRKQAELQHLLGL